MMMTEMLAMHLETDHESKRNIFNKQLNFISWFIVLTINNGIMYGVRVALISIFSIHSEYFRPLEVKIFKYLHIYSAVCYQKQWHTVISCCVEKRKRTYRDWDFVHVAKVRGSYEGWRHVLGINYIDCYGGCGGQHLVLTLVLSPSILRKQMVGEGVSTFYNLCKSYVFYLDFGWFFNPKEFMTLLLNRIKIWFRSEHPCDHCLAGPFHHSISAASRYF